MTRVTATTKRILFPLAGIIMLTGTIVIARSVQGPARTAAPVVTRTASAITAEGRVSAYPDAAVDVSSERAGIVTELPILEKETVRKGDVIAMLRSDDLLASIDEAKARVAEANADMQLAQTELGRAKQLWQEEVGSRQAYDRAARDLDAASARKRTALATVERLQADLEKCRILSPIDGVVVTRRVNRGEAVEARQPIVRIADLRRTRIEAEVDEFDAPRISKGAPVSVAITGANDRTWRGHVDEIPDTVTPREIKPEDPGRPTDARVLLVKVAFDEATPLKLGQRVLVKIAAR
jgi:RND family efflux transporter MFP subunit